MILKKNFDKESAKTNVEKWPFCNTNKMRKFYINIKPGKNIHMSIKIAMS